MDEQSDLWQRAWAAARHKPLAALLAGVLLGTVLGVLGALHVASGPTTWTSRTVMMINDPYELAAAGGSGELVKLDQLRLEYASLASTSVIAGPVARHLHLPESEVAASTVVYASPAALLLDVYGISSSPAVAAEISAAVAHELSTYTSQQETQFAVPVHERYTLLPVDPTAPASPAGPSGGKAAAVGAGLAVIGLVAGFGAVQMARRRGLAR
ncbi:MAG: YveK family protein [Acidimicrobiales bacterium]|nr:hypothetical protein [Actinomycetota bacterium]MDA8186395.1 hypothetical protein [Actinomycetota bacterium]